MIGIGLIAVPVVVFAAPTSWAFSNPGLSSGAPALVAGCALLVAVVLAAVGVYFFLGGQREARRHAEIEHEKQVLAAVRTRGEVKIGDLAVEMNTTADQIKKYVYDLVGKGLFTGYVSWKGGKLFSQEAAVLARTIRETGKCADCGASLALGGKGVVACSYCGAEYFLELGST
jgi:DNA-directed RNA polymerase subunit RPC12/RpoP